MMHFYLIIILAKFNYKITISDLFNPFLFIEEEHQYLTNVLVQSQPNGIMHCVYYAPSIGIWTSELCSNR